MMKKFFTLLFAVAILASCNNDDDNYTFDVDWESGDFIALGTTTDYSLRKSEDILINTSHPLGWTVKITNEKVSITAPSTLSSETEASGKVILSTGKSFSLSLDVYTGIVAGFEDVPQEILAVDAEGKNFYEKYEGQSYTGYTDNYSGLEFTVNPSEYGINFSNGGTFFSTWNKDLETGIWENQCTINYVDPTTGNGGHNGSKVFAIVGYNAYQELPTSISFADAGQFVIDHIWVMNTVYTSFVIEKGNDLSNPNPISENNGYLYITATGYNAQGVKTSSADFYLADYRTADSPGLLKEWAKFDLSPLGKVKRVEFTMASSDNDPDYGMNTPGYFCFDDVAIRY